MGSPDGFWLSFVDFWEDDDDGGGGGRTTTTTTTPSRSVWIYIHQTGTCMEHILRTLA